MKKLKGAFIGFGNIAELGHWPSYASSSDLKMTAALELSPRRQKAAKALGLRTYSSLDDMFQKEELDFVDICTPPSFHAEHAEAALDAKCHVLCEKPLTLKMSDYEALSKAMTKAKRTVFTVHNWKYAPIIQKALSVLRSGKIGPVWHVDIFTLRNNVCEGTAKSENWRLDPSFAGGGILVDHGWHAFYLLLNLMNTSPERILAKMLKDRDDPESLEEAVQALVQFPEADGYIHLTWRAKMRRNNFIIQGQKGTLLIDDDRLLLTTHTGQKEEVMFEPALSAGSHHPDWFESLLPDFIEEMRNPVKRGANFKEAGWCLALTSAAYQSNLQGFKEVPVDFLGAAKLINA